MYPNFQCHLLDNDHKLWSSKLSDELIPTTEIFEELWQLHPINHHQVQIHGRLTKIPRWEQAYNKNYQYSGNINKALPIPELIKPFWSWGRENIEDSLNGILLNWYDGSLGHYIGKHRDSTTNLVEKKPIVTISLGEKRLFRLRPWRNKGYQDFLADNGTVFILPYETNLMWTHEVPASKKLQGKRISITLRVFEL